MFYIYTYIHRTQFAFCIHLLSCNWGALHIHCILPIHFLLKVKNLDSHQPQTEIQDIYIYVYICPYIYPIWNQVHMYLEYILRRDLMNHRICVFFMKWCHTRFLSEMVMADLIPIISRVFACSCFSLLSVSGIVQFFFPFIQVESCISNSPVNVSRFPSLIMHDSC